MILLQISFRLIIVYIFLIPLMIFIHAGSPKESVEITLESEAVIQDPIDGNGFFGFVALPFKKVGAFFKKMIYKEPPKSWGYVHNNVAVFAYKGEKEYMEDRFFIHENFENTGVSIYAIFDGHGGDFSAKYAVENLMKSLKEKIIKLKKNPNSDENLKMYAKDDTIEYLHLLKNEIEAFDKKLLKTLTIQKIQQIFNNQKNQKIRDTELNLQKYTLRDGSINVEKIKEDYGIKEEDLKEKPYLSGATASIVLIDKDQLFVATVGSKPLIMCISTDKNDQSATNKDEPAEENKPHYSLGDLEKKISRQNVATPSLSQYDLVEKKSEFLIMPSSGLRNTFDDDKDVVTFIDERIRKNEKFFGAYSIVFEAEKRGHQKNPPIETDNITVMILKTFNAHVHKLLNS